MTSIEEIRRSARAGADSVFSYIERAAEPVPDGIRWRTKSYQNEMRYHSSVYNGVAGISAFLSDYHRVRGSSRARELAESALRWCSAPDQLGTARSLMAGRAGLGMSWLRYSEATGDPQALARAADAGVVLLESTPGPITDASAGVAGQGIFLIRLGQATRDQRFLDGAERAAEWLIANATREASGWNWVFAVDDEKPSRSLGFAHGVAGIAYFLLLVTEATGEARCREAVPEALRTLSSNAIPDHGGLNWPHRPGETTLTRCQFCHGAPGVGLFLAKASEVLGDSKCLEMAVAAGEATFAYGDLRGNPSQCHGLAGNAELFLELFYATGDRMWLERAHDFAVRAGAYRSSGPEGDSWQSDVAGIQSPDFMCGAAGVGHFFLRLESSERLRLPFG